MKKENVLRYIHIYTKEITKKEEREKQCEIIHLVWQLRNKPKKI